MVQPICYAAILDAGSSGTRLYMFRWKKWVEGTSVPQIEEVYNKKREPGISTLVGDDNDPLQKKVNDHLGHLFDCAVAFCTAAGVNSNSVPLFLLATAGMRALETEDNQRYLQLLPCIERCTNNSKFDVKQCGTITGEAEALYGWIAANYSLGSFSGYGLRSSQAAGYVEMGGASAQIAFPLGMGDIPDGYQQRLVKVKIGPSEFDMFLASYLLGSDKAIRQYEATLLAANPDMWDGAILEPSKNIGWGMMYQDNLSVVPPINTPHSKTIGEGDQVTRAIGSLNFAKLRLLLSQIPVPAPNFPQHLVDIINNRHWVGGSNFWNNTRKVFGLDPTGQPKQTPFNFQEYRAEVESVSKLTWSNCKARRPGVTEKYMANACFTAEWIQRVLGHYFQFQNINQMSFTPYNGADGVDLSWTLGKVILLSLDSQPQEMNANVVRAVNELRGQAKDRDAMACRREAEAQEEMFKALDFNERAARLEVLIEEDRTTGINPQAFVDEDRAAGEQARTRCRELHDEAEVLKGETQNLWNQANAAETNGVDAILVAQRWF